jgi:hypothetical protein
VHGKLPLNVFLELELQVNIMARLRLHYTPNQITKGLYTTGSVWQTELGLEYIGAYHTYVTGEVYSESEWNSTKSVKLIPIVYEEKTVTSYKQLKTITPGKRTPQSYTPIVTQNDRVAGFITRYFIKKTNELKIIEINLEQFNAYLSNEFDKNLYQTISIKWIITGSLETQYKNGVKIPSVAQQNLTAIQVAQQTMPGIISILTNPIQYYSDVDIIVPRDINGLNS